jgi:hypothetical protein
MPVRVKKIRQIKPSNQAFFRWAVARDRPVRFQAQAQAPFSHFFMKLVFAAPASGLPSELTALVAQESAMHFFMNDVFAAPASALPSLPTALLSHVSCAIAVPTAKIAIIAARNTPLNMSLSFGGSIEI